MNLSSPVKLLVCALLCYLSIVVAKSHKPEQVRLQLTGVSGEVVITYTTGSSANPDTAHPSDPAKIPRTFCSYGLKGTKDMSMVEGAEYVYQVGDESKEDGLSDFFTFTAGVPKRWAVYGDYGTEFIEKSLKDLIKARKNNLFDGTIHVGDIAYDLHDDFGKRGDDFFNRIEPVAASAPYHLTPGNHEKHNNFTHYSNRFAALKHLGDNSGSDTPLHYSYDVPNGHFIFFDTEVFDKHRDEGAIARQYHWLEADLKAANKPANRQERPWIVTFAHKCDWQDKVEYNVFRELFHVYGVDLHICGHEHNYQRLFPGMQDTVEKHDKHTIINPKHWMQMVIGSPGAEDHISHNIAPYPNAHAATVFNYGFGLLELYNSTHLYWEFRQTSESPQKKAASAFDQLVGDLQRVQWSKERAKYKLQHDEPESVQGKAEADPRQPKGLNEQLRGDEDVKDYMWLIQAHHGMRT